MSASFGDKQYSCPVVKKKFKRRVKLIFNKDLGWRDELVVRTLGIPTKHLDLVPIIHMGAHNLIT